MLMQILSVNININIYDAHYFTERQVLGGRYKNYAYGRGFGTEKVSNTVVTQTSSKYIKVGSFP